MEKKTINFFFRIGFLAQTNWETGIHLQIGFFCAFLCSLYATTSFPMQFISRLPASMSVCNISIKLFHSACTSFVACETNGCHIHGTQSNLAINASDNKSQLIQKPSSSESRKIADCFLKSRNVERVSKDQS